jgi:hypothetical protein
MFDPDDPGPEYALRWPRELFRREATALLSGPHSAVMDWTRKGQLLLEEAFVDDTPRQDLGASAWGEPFGETSARNFLRSLRDATQSLPTPVAPRPYWSARRGAGPATPDRDSGTSLQQDWAQVVTQLQVAGYFEKVAPTPCVDDRGNPPQPTDQLERLTAERIGRRGLWPLEPRAWDQDSFYDLVEVVDDFVARPRDRWTHDFGDCGFHYGSLAVRAGQAVYRWRVNELFDRHGADVQLATDGEDAGRLVRVAGDPRDELLKQALATPSAADRGEVAHAVALFRGRSSSREDKRSGIVTLARVLEHRRALVKASFLSKDEGALFQIANNFDLRHRRADQQGDYDEAFLDWVFWWYLGTIELTNRLLARSLPDEQ